MTATISTIQQAARGGFARVDAAGDWNTGGKGLGGRMVAWFTGIVSPGRVANENRAAIDHFVQAIGSDTRYGNQFFMLAAERLRPMATAGKPLRERVVTQVLSEIEDMRTSRDLKNHAVVDRFSNTDAQSPSQNYPDSFTNKLRKAAQKHDLPQSIETIHASHIKKAAEDIQQEILSIGGNGKNLVPWQEARNIAEKRIGELTDQMVTLRDILVSSDMSKEEKQSLKQRLTDEPNLSKEIILSYSHGGRANELAYESGELAKMLSQATKDQGLSELGGDLTLLSGVDSGMVIRVTDRLKADSPDAVASKDEIRSRLNDEVTSYVADRKKLMNHADSRNLTGGARAEMHKIIAQDPSIKTTEQIDVIIAAATGCGAFCQSISMSGGTEDMAAAFVRYQNSFERAMEPLMHPGITIAEVAPQRNHALSLWAAQQQDKQQSSAPAQSADIQRDMQLAYNNLTGASGDRWVDSTVWVAEQHRRVDGNVDNIARTVQNLRHTMAAEIGDYLGIKPADGSEASPTREGIAGNISGEADVADNVYCMFRDLGVKVPLPELMGRSKAEAFDNHFSKRFLDAINEELQSTRGQKNGVDSTMYRDLNRANYFAGAPGTAENLLTSAHIGEGKEAALRVFNEVFADDEAGKQAVSKATHQGIFAEIDKAHIYECGPFSKSVIREQATNKSDVSYRVWQEPGGTGYRVQAALSAPVQAIVNVVDGAMYPTDMETSKFAFESTFRISRQSIDEGNPRAELLTAPTYDYQINPAQED